MFQNISYKYSIVIRTLGQGGKKYQALLDSIKSQTIQPNNIYVIIADGYSLPEERIGSEKFIYTKKGMWHQRVYGLQYAANRGQELLFVCDDDISFDTDCIEKLIYELNDSNADILIPNIGEFTSSKSPWLLRFLLAFLGSRYEVNNDNPLYYVSITNTGGHKLHRKIKGNTFKTQSGQFACFLLKSECVNTMRLEEEYWLDQTPYALPDDQVFFYKAFSLGYNVMYCKRPFITHLDHGSSSPSRKKDAAFSGGRNFLIFWYRFLWASAPSYVYRMKLICGISHRVSSFAIWYILNSLFKRQNLILPYLKGIKSGMGYIITLRQRKSNC